MLARLRLVRYKGFSEFTLNFKGNSILVGPNNAGKTTIIDALRLCSYLIRQAHVKKPEIAVFDRARDRNLVGYLINLPVDQYIQENIHHEFRDEEARIELQFDNKAKLYAVWPVDDEPYFYLEHVDGMQPRSIRTVREYYNPLGIVATLSPLENRERVLSADHVRDNLATRLVSRHFRNQLHWHRERWPDDYDDLMSYIVSNTPEIQYLELVSKISGTERELDLYYCEATTHTEKEIYWAGGGLQIWLQVLFHIWRQQELPTLVLDEPDVFLHPDLQRRLVHVLEDVQPQVILATHAPEILSEASRDSVVIVDRYRKHSRRVDDDRALASLNDAIGSGFNLRLAKTLRSRVALFVEGQDIKILRNLATTIGAKNLSSERGIAVVPMGGYSKRGMSEAFEWLNANFLNKAVKTYVILDRDYRTDETVAKDREELEEAGVRAHIWRRKELESYLLEPSVIARVSRLDRAVVEGILQSSMEGVRGSVMARFLAERSLANRGPRAHEVTVHEQSIALFEQSWTNEEWRLSVVPPKEVLSVLNREIQAAGGKAVSTRALSARIRADEVPTEMRDVILSIEDMLVSPV